MRKLSELASYLEEKQKNFEKNLIEAQENTAQQVWADIIDNAPFKTGDYVSSIQIDPTTIERGKITTFIGSDLIVGPALSTGKSYNLGYLLENGTADHYIYPVNSEVLAFKVMAKDKEGNDIEKTAFAKYVHHPGTSPILHYSLALEKNKELYKGNIKMAWRETK